MDSQAGGRWSWTIGTGAWGLGKVGPREMRSRKHRATNPYRQEHRDLAASILGDGPYRMATYSGNLVT